MDEFMLRQYLVIIVLLAAARWLPAAQAIALNQDLPSEASGGGDANYRDGSQKVSRTSAYWLAPSIGSVNKIGVVVVSVHRHGRVQLLTPSIESKSGSLVCVGTTWNNYGNV
ncbi:MAG: hypothetical protein WB424_16295, partial [Terracidiphilus sp.]